GGRARRRTEHVTRPRRHRLERHSREATHGKTGPPLMLRRWRSCRLRREGFEPAGTRRGSRPVMIESAASESDQRGALLLDADWADKLGDGRQTTRRSRLFASVGKAPLEELARVWLECPPVRAAPCDSVAAGERSEQPRRIDLRSGLVEAT